MAVDVEKDPPAVLPLIGEGGQLTDGNQVGMVEEQERIFFGEASPLWTFAAMLQSRTFMPLSPPTWY